MYQKRHSQIIGLKNVIEVTPIPPFVFAPSLLSQEKGKMEYGVLVLTRYTPPYSCLLAEKKKVSERIILHDHFP